MPVSIAMPQKQKSTIDALSDGLGAISRAYEMKRGFDKAGIEDELYKRQKQEYEKKISEEAALRDPMSQQSAMARRAMAQAGVQVGDDVSAFDIEKNFGGPSDYNKAKFKSQFEKENKDPLDAAYKKKQIEKIAFDMSPDAKKREDADSVVKGLAQKNASKLAIANQIDAVIKTLDDPTVPEDQKIVQGKQLLKVLNSTEGSDAVGAEESKRLGSLLEFQIFNFTNPGPVFGRADISEFSNQSKLTSNAIKDSIAANQSQIDALRAGQSPLLTKFETKKKEDTKSPLLKDAVAGQKVNVTEEDIRMLNKAKERLAKNPNDQSAINAMAILKQKGLK